MNKKKGFTLVEVLVSITIFLTVFSVILSTYYLAQKRVYKQEEAQYIENLCLDIDKVYDNEGYEGLVKYYEFETLKYTKDESSDIKKEKIGEIDAKYFNDNESTDDSDTNVDGDDSGEETPSNDDESDEDNVNEETASTDDNSSTDSDSSSDDISGDETEDEKVNQVKEVVKYLISDKTEDESNYLNSIVKTSENITSTTRDENKKEKSKDESGNEKPSIEPEEPKYSEDKKYDVSIQEYTLKYEEYVHNETINGIKYQKDNFSKEGSIYLDSNYKQVDSNDSYKYLLTYSFSGYLYEINTSYTISEYTNNVVETFNEYTTTKSYTKDKTNETEDSYTEDEDTVDYKPTAEEINLKKTLVKDESTNKETKMLRTEYIMDIKKTTSLTITITNIKDNYVLIKDLEYGSSKYDDTTINSIKEEMEDSKGEYDEI